MTISLDMIDWTAIGAITSLLMTVAAFATVYSSIVQNEKSRKLQIKLIRQQQAQQRLDDMVGTILNISHNINPFHIFNYSSKLTSNRFTEEDRNALERLTIDDYFNNINLTIHTIRLNSYQSSKTLLNRLQQIRTDYGLWSGIVNTLSQFDPNTATSDPQIEQAVLQMTSEMKNRCLEIAPQTEVHFSVIFDQKTDVLDRALKVLGVFETICAQNIQKQQRMLDHELIQFVKGEQLRIDRMIE